MNMNEIKEQRFDKGDVLYRLGALRQIEEVRPTGYSWVPFMHDKSVMQGCKPIFRTDDERDPMMDIGWTRVLPPSKPDERLTTFDSVHALIEKLREIGVTIDSDSDHETIVVNTRAEEAEKQLQELKAQFSSSNGAAHPVIPSVADTPILQLMESGPTIRSAVIEMNSRSEFENAA